jgi:hypothetical protein
MSRKVIEEPIDTELAAEAKALVLLAFRNGPLENIHAGTVPSSEAGDFSDVMVQSPYGEIPWTKLGRICDEEIKHLMQFAVNKIYTLLCMREYRRETFDALVETTNRLYTRRWDEPRLIEPHAVENI